MTSCSGSCENELTEIDHVYEQPVWLDVAFAESCVITSQCVITVFYIKLRLFQKHLRYLPLKRHRSFLFSLYRGDQNLSRQAHHYGEEWRQGRHNDLTMRIVYSASGCQGVESINYQEKEILYDNSEHHFA